MNDVKRSRFLSLILRHQPEVIGISLDEHGWADVEELLKKLGKTKYAIDMDDLERIVAEDEKTRYSFNEDRTRIRANQGHSINVDVELEKKAPPEVLWHGTAGRFADTIRKEGLRPMNRLYVHLSSDYETAVKVGGRHGKPTVFMVQSGRMAEEGFDFYLSANGVWLTKKVPPEYLDR